MSKFNARLGLSVGPSPLDVIDVSGNATFASLVSNGIVTVNSISNFRSIKSQATFAVDGTQAIFGINAGTTSVNLSAGAWLNDSNVWVHQSNGTVHSEVLQLLPGTGVQWYASSNSSASWNVANAVQLWNTSGTWTSAVSSGSITTGLGYTPINKAGDTGISGTLSFDVTAERDIKASGTGINWGFYLTSTGFGLYDWQNTRTVLGYTAATNILNSASALTITNSTVSSSAITGALTVSGGAGVSGDLYIGSSIYTTAGNIVASQASTSVSIAAKAPAGFSAFYQMYNNNFLRSTLTLDSTGNNLIVQSFNSSGVSIDSPITIPNVASSPITFARPLSGQSYLTTDGTSTSVEKVMSVVFSNGVANQKADILFGNISFSGPIEVTLSGTYTSGNSFGAVTKVYTFGGNAGGTILENDSRYTEAMGAAPNDWALSDITWDATASSWKIQIVHRTSVGNTARIRIKSLNSVAGSAAIYNATLSAVYTTDTTVFPLPVISFFGAVTGTSFNAITGLSNTNPLMDGTVAQGTSTLVARQDHVHPTDTSRAADSLVVHLSGTETITGQKTFTPASIATLFNYPAAAVPITVNVTGPKNPALQINGGDNNENQPASLQFLQPSMAAATTRGPEIYFISTRATATQVNAGTFVAIQANDQIGKLHFSGDNGVTRRSVGATVYAIATETWSGTTNAASLVFATTPTGSTAPTNRLTIDSAGLASFGNNISVTGTGTFTSSVTAVGGLNIDNAPGTGGVKFRSAAGLFRWHIYHSNTETGANAGSDIFFRAFDDAGSAIDFPISVVRASGGSITLARPLSGTTATFSGAISSTLSGPVGRTGNIISAKQGNNLLFGHSNTQYLCSLGAYTNNGKPVMAFYSYQSDVTINTLKRASGTNVPVWFEVDTTGNFTFKAAAAGTVDTEITTGIINTVNIGPTGSVSIANGSLSVGTSGTFGGAVVVSGSTSAAAGSYYSNATYGMALWSKTGSTYDFFLHNPANNAGIMYVPTGTNNVGFGGSITTTSLSSTGSSIINSTNASTGTLTIGASSGAQQNILKIYGDVTADKAPILSLFRSGNTEGFATMTSSKLRLGATTGLANYQDATLVAAPGLSLDTSGNAILDGSITTKSILNTFGSNTGAGTTNVLVNAAAGQYRYFTASSAGVGRWSMGADNTAESGSNAGSNFILAALADAGTTIDVPISIARVAGGTMTLSRPITASAVVHRFGNSAGAVDFGINAAAGSNRDLFFYSNSSARWGLRTGSAETGSDAGSNFSLVSYTDAGAQIDAVLSITRATGGTIAFSSARPVTMGALSATTGAFSGTTSVSAAASANAVFYVNGNGGTNGTRLLIQSSADNSVYVLNQANAILRLGTNNINDRLVIAASGEVSLSSTTTSTSVSTGSFVTLGGAGIAGNLYVGGKTVISGGVVAGSNTFTLGSGASYVPEVDLYSTHVITLTASGTQNTISNPTGTLGVGQTFNILVIQPATPNANSFAYGTNFKFFGNKLISVTGNGRSLISCIWDGTYWQCTVVKDSA